MGDDDVRGCMWECVYKYLFYFFSETVKSIFIIYNI